MTQQTINEMEPLALKRDSRLFHQDKGAAGAPTEPDGRVDVSELLALAYASPVADAPGVEAFAWTTDNPLTQGKHTVWSISDGVGGQTEIAFLDWAGRLAVAPGSSAGGVAFDDIDASFSMIGHAAHIDNAARPAFTFQVLGGATYQRTGVSYWGTSGDIRFAFQNGAPFVSFKQQAAGTAPRIISQVADALGAVAFEFDTANELGSIGTDAVLARFLNQGTEIARINLTGEYIIGHGLTIQDNLIPRVILHPTEPAVADNVAFAFYNSLVTSEEDFDLLQVGQLDNTNKRFRVTATGRVYWGPNRGGLLSFSATTNTAYFTHSDHGAATNLGFAAGSSGHAWVNVDAAAASGFAIREDNQEFFSLYGINQAATKGFTGPTMMLGAQNDPDGYVISPLLGTAAGPHVGLTVYALHNTGFTGKIQRWGYGLTGTIGTSFTEVASLDEKGNLLLPKFAIGDSATGGGSAASIRPPGGVHDNFLLIGDNTYVQGPEVYLRATTAAGVGQQSLRLLLEDEVDFDSLMEFKVAEFISTVSGTKVPWVWKSKSIISGNMVEWRNDAALKAFMDWNGILTVNAINGDGSGLTNLPSHPIHSNVIMWASGAFSEVVDGPTAEAFRFATDAPYANAASRLMAVYNDTAASFTIGPDGTIRSSLNAPTGNGDCYIGPYGSTSFAIGPATEIDTEGFQWSALQWQRLSGNLITKLNAYGELDTIPGVLMYRRNNIDWLWMRMHHTVDYGPLYATTAWTEFDFRTSAAIWHGRQTVAAFGEPAFVFNGVNGTGTTYNPITVGDIAQFITGSDTIRVKIGGQGLVHADGFILNKDHSDVTNVSGWLSWETFDPGDGADDALSLFGAVVDADLNYVPGRPVLVDGSMTVLQTPQVRLDGLGLPANANGYYLGVGPDGKTVMATPQGVPQYSEQVQDALNYDVSATAGVWVQVTATPITLVQDLPAGSRVAYNAFVREGSGNRAGTIEFGYGVDGAQPAAGFGAPKIVGPGASFIDQGAYTLISGLNSGQTIALWARATNDHVQTDINVDGTVVATILNASTADATGTPDDTMSGIAGEALAIGDLCYFGTDGKFHKADNTAESSAKGLLGVCLETLALDESGNFRLSGNQTLSGLTTGEVYYLGTAGGVTATAPGSGNVARVVGYALSTTMMRFTPDMTWVVVA